MTITHRLLPPASGPFQTVSAVGRQYVGTPGVAQDVPVGDAGVLEANGWTYVAASGATADRPHGDAGQFPARRGASFYDTTLGVMITYDGALWRDPTGAAV